MTSEEGETLSALSSPVDIIVLAFFVFATLCVGLCAVLMIAACVLSDRFHTLSSVFLCAQAVCYLSSIISFIAQIPNVRIFHKDLILENSTPFHIAGFGWVFLMLANLFSWASTNQRCCITGVMVFLLLGAHSVVVIGHHVEPARDVIDMVLNKVALVVGIALYVILIVKIVILVTKRVKTHGCCTECRKKGNTNKEQPMINMSSNSDCRDTASPDSTTLCSASKEKYSADGSNTGTFRRNNGSDSSLLQPRFSGGNISNESDNDEKQPVVKVKTLVFNILIVTCALKAVTDLCMLITWGDYEEFRGLRALRLFMIVIVTPIVAGTVTLACSNWK